jgi:two-component sensor histidine kinase
MALMHQVLYERKDFARVELDIYLERLSGLLVQIHGAGSRGIRVRLDVERITLDLTRAIPLGLIVNELLCNAFKHAFPDGAGGEVRVELHAKDGSGASLQVRDNGQGLAGRQASQTGDTLGMQIVTLLAEQIGGELAACRGSGACFELRFTPCSDGEGNDEECGKTE